MTQIYLEQDGNRYTVSAKGHATGSTETCAAISTLLFTLAGWLHNATTHIVRENLNPGDAMIEFVGGSNAETAFDMVFVGFLQLEKSQPDAIHVNAKIIS